MKKRSPRFPFVALPAAVKLTSSVEEVAQGNPVSGEQIAQAFGHQVVNGKANKQIAALVSYGLLERGEKTDDGKRQFTVSDLAKRILAQERPRLAKVEVRQAALNPMPFRRIWHQFPQPTADDLEALLIKRGFTEQGAKRGADVYLKNVDFANLEDAEFRASGDAPKAPTKKAAKKKLAGRRGMGMAGRGMKAGPAPDRLVLPVGDGVAMIPAGMTEEDFQMLLKTLHVWKEKLVVPKKSS